MRLLSSLLAMTLVITIGQSQDTPPIYSIEAQQDQVLTYQLSLDGGILLNNLSWAWDSQNACFVETSAPFFKGNHVLFKTEIPKYSTMVIRLIPTDPKVNMSLYAYSGGRGDLPPKLHGCVSCEADFYQDRPSVNRPNPDHTRSVELRAVNRAYPITIGVAGAEGVVSGDFKLEVSVKRNR